MLTSSIITVLVGEHYNNMKTLYSNIKAYYSHIERGITDNPLACHAVLMTPQRLWLTSTHLQVFKRNGCFAVLTWHRTFGTLIVDMPLLTGSGVLHSTAMFTTDNNIGTMFLLVLLSIEDKIINYDVTVYSFFDDFSDATILYKSYQISGIFFAVSMNDS